MVNKSAEFTKGTILPLNNGDTAVVQEKLGEGGQGTVYRVTVGNSQYALKWYHNNSIHDPKKFYQNLDKNVGNGAPADTFLWPKFLTEINENSFGYVMDVRPPQYRDFSEFLLAKARFKSLTAAVNAALNITNGFRDLHRKGFSYQDLNDGNFFINPENGDVLICDNDNVAGDKVSLGIAGKARYMAPEIVRNIELPNNMTDRFSLAVILFRLLFLDHPLEGKRTLCPCMTPELDLKFYGKDPIFIFDPDDDSNRPVRGVHSNAIKFWPMYPKFVRDKFIQAFSKDAMQGNVTRISDNDWQILFTQLRDVIVTCPCGTETFLDLNEPASFCLGCGIKIPKPPVLNVKKYQVVLFPGIKLYRCHTDDFNDSYTEVHGEVIRNPKRPEIWGLINLSTNSWQAVDNEGNVKTIGQGEVVVIVKTKEINFYDAAGKDKCTGKIICN